MTRMASVKPHPISVPLKDVLWTAQSNLGLQRVVLWLAVVAIAVAVLPLLLGLTFPVDNSIPDRARPSGRLTR